MFKKIISIVSAAALGVCCLTGCSNDTAGDKGDKDAKELQPIIIDKMFDMMMPKGAKNLTLSKMNMGGLGSAMMKWVMKNKNISTLSELITQAQKNGIKFIACNMSMDVMGIKKEELLEGVEIGGVAKYISESNNANSNLFI